MKVTRQVQRIEPALPVSAMQSYEIAAPLTSHFRKATCAEVECVRWRDGWRTVVNTATELGASQAYYINNSSGRRFVASEEGAVVTFTFPPGQTCFADHGVRLDRPEIFIRRPGDWRGFTGAATVFQGRNAAANWVDDFANNQNTIIEAQKRG